MIDMFYTKAQVLAMNIPIILVVLLMLLGNYNDSKRPILSKRKTTVYRIISAVIGICGLAGAFGVIDIFVPGFHKTWGVYLFSSLMLLLWLKEVDGKSVKLLDSEDA
jgi:hypothetical protein